MRLVINRCFGGFGLSEEALAMYNESSGKNEKYVRDIERNCPFLVAVVDMLGERANSRFSDLEVIEIPDGIDWRISEYDGMEEVAEGRTWP